MRTARGDLPAAEDAYTRSLDLRERLADQLGTPQALRDLAYTLERLADLRSDENLRARSQDIRRRIAALEEPAADAT